MADPAAIATILSTVTGSPASAANVFYHLVTLSRASKQVEPLDPAAVRAKTRLKRPEADALERLLAEIKTSYKRALPELREDEAQPLFDALRNQIVHMVQDSAGHSDQRARANLEELRRATNGGSVPSTLRSGAGAAKQPRYSTGSARRRR